MKYKTWIVVILCTLLATLISGCGPSEEEIATMTASSWTATPTPTFTPTLTFTPTPTPTFTPTFTPTPIPFDLDLTVTDMDGNPIAGAKVVFNEETQITDSEGLTTWLDLPDEVVEVSISASGFFPGQLSESIERGKNQLSVSLELDPNGLLPANACIESETLLYIDDFQDGLAQEWDAIESAAPGWTIEPDPENPDDLVVAARGEMPWAWLGGRETYNFDNAVWRLRFKQEGEGWAHANFRFVENSAMTRRYLIGLHEGISPGWLDESNHIELGSAGEAPKGEWHLLEIGFFDGTLTVYLDGKEGMTWADPNAWEGGTINLEPYPQGDGVFYFDDFAICELNAPFEPLPRPKTGYDLTVSISDAEGNPIPQTSVTVVELGDDDQATLLTDDHGLASWVDLPGETVTLQVKAPGYYVTEEILTIEKNVLLDTGITLETDPFALMPETACAPGETLLYIEDFQDNDAQGWPDIQFNTPGWSFATDPSEPTNIVVSAQYNPANQGRISRLEGWEFENAAWRIYYMPTAHFPQNDYLAFNWLHALEPFDLDGTQVFDSRYQIPVGWNYFAFQRLQQPVTNVAVGHTGRLPVVGEWNLVEIGTFDGTTEIWLNGTRLFSYQDPKPLPPGTISLEIQLPSENAPILYFDNIAVCELSAPFAPLPVEE